MHKVFALSLLLPSLALAAPVDFLPAKQIGMELARDIATLSVEACRKDGYNVSAVVLDRAGNVQAALRDTLATHHTLEIAERKAGMAVMSGSDTGSFRQARGDIRPELNHIDVLIVMAGGAAHPLRRQPGGGRGGVRRAGGRKGCCLRRGCPEGAGGPVGRVLSKAVVSPAQALLQAYRQHQRLVVGSHAGPAGADMAYAAQAEVWRELAGDERPTAWKVAAAGHFWRLADNLLNGGFVLGDKIPGWRNLDFGQLTTRVLANAGLVPQTRGRPPLGDLFHCLPWWIVHVGGVWAGDVVTTGAWNGMHPVALPASVQVEFLDGGERLGRAEVHVR